MIIVTNRELHANRSGLDKFGKRPNRNGPNELRMVEVTHTGRRRKVEIIPDDLDARWRRRAGMDRKWLDSMGCGAGDTVHGSMYAAKTLLGRVNPQRAGVPGEKGANLLVFVHGYNNDMKDVVERARGFEKNFGVEVLAFSWPANGGGVTGTASYLSDKNDAKISIVAFDRTLAKLDDYLRRFNTAWIQEIQDKAAARFPDNDEHRREMVSRLVDKGCPFTVSLTLHSMGNYLYKHLLLSTASMGTSLMFDNVVLAAADANNEKHALWVDKIRARHRIFVTINEKDSALRASRIKLGEQQRARLGHYPYDLDATKAVYVDFTGAPHVGGSHAYFEGRALDNARCRRFFREAFNGRAAERRLPYDVASNTYSIKQRR